MRRLWAKQASQYNISIYVYIKIFIIKEIYVCGYILSLKHHGRSKTFSEHRQAKTRSKTTSVLFIIRIDLKTMYIYNIMKTKNIIYCAHIGVDPGMSTMGDVLWWHPNHSSWVNIFHTVSVEWIIISPYAAFKKVRP